MKKRIKLTRRYANGGSITGLSDNDYSNGIFRFNGPSHRDGGIPISYNGTDVEVEGDETGYIDQSGDLNIFGNMYVPGTKKKFKSLSKDIAKAESKAQNRLRRATNIMDSVEDFDDPIQRLSANAASVMGKSAMNQQKMATTAKENLATLQNNMLSYSNALGVNPKQLFGKAQNGQTIPYRPREDRRKEESLIVDNLIPGIINKYREPEPYIQVPYDRLGYDLEKIEGVRKDDSSSISTRLTNRIPSIQSQKQTSSPRFATTEPTVYNQGLGIGQILPELYTLATNRQEFVPTQFYTPQLYQPYRVSFQDRLNQNQSTFRAIANAAQNNPAALSQLAAQKYNADQAVLSEEFRTNQSIQDQITNRNIDLINQSQLTNLQLGRENAELRAQNAAATRATTRAAITSIASKNLQQQQYNRGLTLYNQLIPHYKYDPRTSSWNFESQGPADINVGGVSVNTPSATNLSNLYGESRVTSYQRDPKGRVLQRAEQRSPGLLRIFRRN